jgi:hypothetical protein
VVPAKLIIESKDYGSSRAENNDLASSLFLYVPQGRVDRFISVMLRFELRAWPRKSKPLGEIQLLLKSKCTRELFVFTHLDISLTPKSPSLFLLRFNQEIFKFSLKKLRAKIVPKF